MTRSIVNMLLLNLLFEILNKVLDLIMFFLGIFTRTLFGCNVLCLFIILFVGLLFWVRSAILIILLLFVLCALDFLAFLFGL